MRTLCDVCEAAPARYFCAADEAALCAKCDEKIHGCNKLAVRHVRLELAEARKVSSCDVCETNPAYFFCGIDGTSLCLQCDMDVHVGGKRTHERYLLMGQRVELPNSFCNKDVGPLKQTESLKDYQRLASSDTQKHLHQNQHHDPIGNPKCSDDWNNSNAPAAAIAIGEARSIDCHQVDSISRPPHLEGGHVRGHQRESGDEQVSSSDDECMGVVPDLYLKDTQTAKG